MWLRNGQISRWRAVCYASRLLVMSMFGAEGGFAVQWEAIDRVPPALNSVIDTLAAARPRVQ
jgi:hypothetical protein